MKKFLILVSIIALSASIFAEDKKPAAPAPAPAAAPATAAPEVQADVSYSLGMLFGANIKSSGLKLSPDGFLAGLKDALDGKPLKYTDAQAQANGLAYGLLQRHATMLAFVDDFWLMGLTFLILIPLMFLMKKSRPHGGPPMAH